MRGGLSAPHAFGWRSVATREEKAIIRKNVVSARKLLTDAEVRLMSEEIGKCVTSMPEFLEAQTVMLYIPFRNEVDTAFARAMCEREGKSVVLPRTVKAERRLIPTLIEPGTALITGEYGIPEPPATAVALDVSSIDFVCVPGVAFSPSCHRLGYGGGYYDRFMSLRGFRAFACGLAFSIQVMPVLPVTRFDRPVDAVATELDLFRRSNYI